MVAGDTAPPIGFKPIYYPDNWDFTIKAGGVITLIEDTNCWRIISVVGVTPEWCDVTTGAPNPFIGDLKVALNGNRLIFSGMLDKAVGSGTISGGDEFILFTLPDIRDFKTNDFIFPRNTLHWSSGQILITAPTTGTLIQCTQAAFGAGQVVYGILTGGTLDTAIPYRIYGGNINLMR